MNMIGQLRQRVIEDGAASLNVDEFNQLQAEWITRAKIEVVPPVAKVPEWIDVNLMLPDNDTNVIGCCDDDVFECHHYDDGAFDDCVGEPVKVEYWMDKPESPYQTGQVSAQGEE